MAADNINLMPEDLRQSEEKVNSQRAIQPELRVPKIDDQELDMSNLSGGHTSWMSKFADRLHQKDVEQQNVAFQPLVSDNQAKTIEKQIPVPVAPITQETVVKPVANKIPNNGFELQEVVPEKLDGQFHQPEKSLHARFIDTAEGVDLVPSSTKIKSWKQISGLILASVFGALGVVAVFYFGLLVATARWSSNESSTANNIATIEEKLLSFEDISKEINGIGKEVNLVYDVLNKHIYWTNFFALVEKYTLPDVYYGSVSASNNGSLTLDATAPDYATVAKQLKILQQPEAVEFVTAVDISSASLGDTGVSFAIEFTLNPNLFYYQTIK